MSETQLDPIDTDWTTTHHHGTVPITATAHQLASTIGGLDLQDLRAHHLPLALAVAELSAAVGMPWPWTVDDPTVALVRAVAKLSIIAPEAAGEAAGRLVEQLRSS